MKRNLSVIGYYTSNFGDLLMLKGLLKTLPPNYCHLFILTYGHLSLTDLGEIGVMNNSITIIDLSKKAKSIVSLIKALITSKAVIWGGGTCFNSKENAYGGLRYMRLFRQFRVRINYIGIGINTNQITPILVSSLTEALRISDNFFVRDKESYNFIRTEIDPSFNSLVPDLIFLNHFSKSLNTCDDKTPRTMVVSYRCVDKYFCNAKEYREWFIKNILMVLNIKSFNKVIVFPSDKTVDYYDNEYIAEAIIKLAPRSVLVDFQDTLSITEALSVIEKSSLVITGRLHVGVVSAFYGVPFQLLDYSSKNRAFVKDVGLNDKVLVSYESLVDEMTISSNINKLEKDLAPYEVLIHETGDLEKRLAILI